MVKSDTDLIHKARQGDNAAFEELVFRYDRRVLSMAYKFTRDPDDAKDIYQEIFIRVFRGLANFRFQSEFSTWLYRIATNVCITYKSKSRKNSQVSLNEFMEDENGNEKDFIEDDGISPYRHASSVDIDKNINDALDTLSSKQKMVFVLKHYEGYKLREIAEMLECKTGTVKKYLFEATHKLRSLLAEVYT